MLLVTKLCWLNMLSFGASAGVAVVQWRLPKMKIDTELARLRSASDGSLSLLR
jgi:hypothetical protein